MRTSIRGSKSPLDASSSTKRSQRTCGPSPLDAQPQSPASPTAHQSPRTELGPLRRSSLRTLPVFDSSRSFPAPIISTTAEPVRGRPASRHLRRTAQRGFCGPLSLFCDVLRRVRQRAGKSIPEPPLHSPRRRQESHRPTAAVTSPIQQPASRSARIPAANGCGKSRSWQGMSSGRSNERTGYPINDQLRTARGAA